MNNRVIRILIIAIIAAFFFPKKGAANNPSNFDLNVGIDANALVAPIDSVVTKFEREHDWFTLLKKGKLNLSDTTVRYPKFLNFCVNAYRWFDRTFNSYDPEWVVGTGKIGKVRLLSDNWLDIYDFRVAETPLVMTSRLYCNLGVQANYSILSVSYSHDINSLFGKEKSKHRKLGFTLTTARVVIDGYYWQNSGDAKIRRAGDMLNGHYADVHFDGLSFRAVGIMGFYIFNNKRFSFAAPYDLSNYQVKSAGSWMTGLSGTFYDADFDFSKLPPAVQSHIGFPFDRYSLDYNSVNLLGGYSYNWKCNRHLLFNSTTLPGVGVSFSFSDSTTGRKDLFSASIRQMLSLTYTNREFFVTGNGFFHGNMLPNGKLAFLSGIVNFQVSSGVRF